MIRKLSHQMNDKIRIVLLIVSKQDIDQRPFLDEIQSWWFSIIVVVDTKLHLELVAEFGIEDLSRDSGEGVSVVGIVEDEVAEEAVEEGYEGVVHVREHEAGV